MAEDRVLGARGEALPRISSCREHRSMLRSRRVAGATSCGPPRHPAERGRPARSHMSAVSRAGNSAHRRQRKHIEGWTRDAVEQGMGRRSCSVSTGGFWISVSRPGGSADLLAAALFLDAEHRQHFELKSTRVGGHTWNEISSIIQASDPSPAGRTSGSSGWENSESCWSLAGEGERFHVFIRTSVDRLRRDLEGRAGPLCADIGRVVHIQLRRSRPTPAASSYVSNGRWR